MLNSRKESGNLHSVDSLRRKVGNLAMRESSCPLQVEYLGVSGMIPRATPIASLNRAFNSNGDNHCEDKECRSAGLENKECKKLAAAGVILNFGGLKGYLANVDKINTSDTRS